MRTLIVVIAIFAFTGCASSTAYYRDGETEVALEGGGKAIVTTTSGNIVEMSTPDPMLLFEQIINQNNSILDAIR